jgi:hypothetical protein
VRLVLDTNTAVSGLIWGGVPGRLIDAAAAGKTQILSSVPLLDELHDVLFRKKFAAQLAEQGVDAVDLFEGYAALVLLETPGHETTLSARPRARMTRGATKPSRERTSEERYCARPPFALNVTPGNGLRSVPAHRAGARHLLREK